MVHLWKLYIKKIVQHVKYVREKNESNKRKWTQVANEKCAREKNEQHKNTSSQTIMMNRKWQKQFPRKHCYCVVAVCLSVTLTHSLFVFFPFPRRVPPRSRVTVTQRKKPFWSMFQIRFSDDYSTVVIFV